jgi:hypothetical protein
MITTEVIKPSKTIPLHEQELGQAGAAVWSKVAKRFPEPPSSAFKWMT